MWEICNEPMLHGTDSINDDQALWSVRSKFSRATILVKIFLNDSPQFVEPDLERDGRKAYRGAIPIVIPTMDHAFQRVTLFEVTPRMTYMYHQEKQRAK